MSPQELANIVYSYHKADNASKKLLVGLMPRVRAALHRMKPRELVCCLVAYADEGFFDAVEQEQPNSEEGASGDEERPNAQLVRYQSEDGFETCQNADFLKEFQ